MLKFFRKKAKPDNGDGGRSTEGDAELKAVEKCEQDMEEGTIILNQKLAENLKLADEAMKKMNETLNPSSNESGLHPAR